MLETRHALYLGVEAVSQKRKRCAKSAGWKAWWALVGCNC